MKTAPILQVVWLLDKGVLWYTATGCPMRGHAGGVVVEVVDVGVVVVVVVAAAPSGGVKTGAWQDYTVTTLPGELWVFNVVAKSISAMVSEMRC